MMRNIRTDIQIIGDILHIHQDEESAIILEATIGHAQFETNLNLLADKGFLQRNCHSKGPQYQITLLGQQLLSSIDNLRRSLVLGVSC